MNNHGRNAKPAALKIRRSGRRLRAGLLLIAAASTAASLAQRPAPGGGGGHNDGGAAEFPRAFRSIDGTGNNVQNPDWGAANTEFLRLMTNSYADGSGAPAGADRPSARAISNAVCAQSGPKPNAAGVSDFLWQWGQFLDHDIDLTPTMDPVEAFDVAVPAGDVWFDPNGTGAVTIPLNRSFYTMVGGVREQSNEITAFIDASNVYGSDADRALALRTLDGTGRLKTSAGNMPPFNVAGFPNAPSADAPNFYLAGDFRANEQVGLLAMHALFVREHNYWAGRIAADPQMFFGEDAGPGGHDGPRSDTRSFFRSSRPQGGKLSGERIYQTARAIVAAELQAITYREFLPLLIGPNALAPYQGYDPNAFPGISNAFSAACYRFGHSMLSPDLLRLDNRNRTIPEGNLSLADAFFSPSTLAATGIDPVLRGLAHQRAQEIDPLVIDEVRNFLFGPPGAGGFDLASLNIQRGRDHGLPGYNQARRDYLLPAAQSFADISSDPQVQARLASVYDSVEDVDLWIGGLAEDKMPGALVGELFQAVFAEQFAALRDGDRFWYQSYLPGSLVDMVERQTLADIIRRNTGIRDEIQDNVFRAGRDGGGMGGGGNNGPGGGGMGGGGNNGPGGGGMGGPRN